MPGSAAYPTQHTPSGESEMTYRFANVGLVLVGMTFGAAAFRGHDAAPMAAFAQEASPSPDAQMRSITDAMQSKLTKNTSKDVDRAYINSMAAINPASVALCKKELAYGKDRQVKAEALKILTIEQEYTARIEELERQFHIDHTS
jgi:uncharacterized protein DUF4142